MTQFIAPPANQSTIRPELYNLRQPVPSTAFAGATAVWHPAGDFDDHRDRRRKKLRSQPCRDIRPAGRDRLQPLTGLAALRRRDYATVIVDESIVEADPAGADLLWKHSARAVPLQINFALLGCARLGREVKAALARREHEQSLAMRAATSSLENDLKSTVTGLLLHSELALSEPSVPPQLASKLKLMVELAGSLRRRLEQPQP